MNLRKGFLRIYTAATVCWALFWLVVALNMRGNESTEAMLLFAVLTPVAAYVLLFIVVPWIWSGFRSRK